MSVYDAEGTGIEQSKKEHNVMNFLVKTVLKPNCPFYEEYGGSLGACGYETSDVCKINGVLEKGKCSQYDMIPNLIKFAEKTEVSKKLKSSFK